MRKYLLSLLVMLLTGMDYALASTMPTLSTPDNPVLYYIRNTRQNKYATLVSTTDFMTEDANKSAAAMFWFEKAGELIDGTYLPVKIHNITTGLAMNNFNAWNANGSVWYIRESNVNADYLGIGITAGSEDQTGNWWNDNGGSWVKSWRMNSDQGSIWDISEVPAEEKPATTTITWNLKNENGEVARTATAAAIEGYTYDIPLSLAIKMTGETTVVGTSSNQTIDLTYTLDLPFKPSTNNTTGTWYKCIMRPDYSEGPKYLHYDNPDVTVKSTNVDMNDMGSWFCFVGNVFDGFKIYCAALTSDKALGGETGNGKHLQAVSIDEAPTFTLEKNIKGTRTYCVFRNNAVPNGYLNDNNSYLAYWVHTNAGTDWGSDWQFEPVDEELNARINAAGTVTYNCYYNGTLLDSKTFRALGGEAYPTVPAVKGFHGEAPEGTINGDATVDVQMTPNITASTDYATATWFRLINKPTSTPLYLNYQEGADAYAMTEEPGLNDNYLWALIGDPINGYKIINKAAGDGMYLNVEGANGNHPVMGTDPQVWTYDESSTPKYFGLGTNGFWINNFANENKLSLWQSGPSGDAGSTLAIEEVNIVDGLYADADGNLLISNANDLVIFAGIVAGGNQTANGKVVADIDLTGVDFPSIGTAALSYKGTFDGQGHTISGYSKEATEQCTGLFGKVEGATVKNIVFKGDLTASYTSGSGSGMIGFANGGTYTNLVSYLNITQTTNAPHTAGIVGSLQGGAKVSYCAYYGTYTIIGNQTDSYGGVVGYTNTGAIDHCINGGTITRENKANNTGGVLGYVNNGSFGGLTNCIGYGNLQATDGTYASAIVGQINTSTNVATIHDNVWLEGSSDRAAYVAANKSNPTNGVLTADDLKSGKAAYLTGLYQNLAEDEYPSIYESRGAVYVARLHCDGSPYDEYTNTATTPVQDEHKFENKVCTVCGQLQKDEDGFFAISNADDWKLFVETVNSGTADGMKTNAKLTADIDLNNEVIAPVGNTGTVVYKGIFDGKGYTINNFYATSSDFSVNTTGYGLFGRVENATIKDFTLNGNFEGTGNSVDGAAIGTVGYVVNSTLQYIISNLNITMDVTGNGAHVGGICGSLRDNSIASFCEYGGKISANAGNQRAGIAAYSNTGRIENCIFKGSIVQTANAGVGGILGYVNNTGFGGIHNCLAIGTLEAPEGVGNVGLIAANLKNCTPSTIENNYYVGEKGVAGTKATDATVAANIIAATEAQLTSGEVAYLLNGDQSNIAFYQAVGTDAVPSVKGTSIVYKVGKKDCTTGEEVEGEFAFANTDEVVESHNYVNGVCDGCGFADEDYKEADADGYYDLATAADVEWFSALINKNGSVDNMLLISSARLTADIDFESVENAHTPIGLNTTYKFNGKFDGQGHRIKNMIINKPDYDAGVGLFGVIRGGTIIENVIIDKSCSITAKSRVGAIAGSAQTLVSNDTWTIIRNCVNEAPLTATEGAAAMVIGGGQSQYPLLSVENCINAGKITAPNKAAAFIGWNNSGGGPGKNSRLVNCVNIGEIDVLDGANTLFRGSYRAYENNYDLVNAGSNQVVKPTWVTEDPIASGELCYYLNKQTSGGTTYYQTIGTDAYPVPFATSNVIYAVGEYNCDGSMISYTGFSNNAEDVNIPEHQMVDGICTSCGIVDEDHITPDAEGWYHLATAADVEWFSGMVNKNRMGGMNVKLDNDIDFEGKENAHMPIGTSASKFFGQFDGQNHSIKGMVITESLVRENADYDGWGFFGSIRGGGIDKNEVTYNNCTIENLTIDSSCSIQTNKNFVAGLVGHVNSRVDNTSVITIQNCGNQANVTTTGKNAAGILGCVEATTVGIVIKNCYNAGNITGANESAAICGWTGTAAEGLVKEASNCWNVGQVSGVDGNGYNLFRIPASGIELVNCYELCESNTGVQGRDYEFATENPAESGELAILFNKNANKAMMAQALGTDMYPTFGSTMEVFETSNGSYGNDYTIDTITWEPLVMDEKWNDTYGNVKGTFTFCGKANALDENAVALIMSKDEYENNGIYGGKHLYGALNKRGDMTINNDGKVEINFTCFSAGTSEPLFQKTESEEGTEVTATSEFVVVIMKNSIEFNSGLYGKNMIFDNQDVLDSIIDEFVATAQGNADGINNVNANNNNVEIYNISGQRVQKTNKGNVYIIDGKKSLK